MAHEVDNGITTSEDLEHPAVGIDFGTTNCRVALSDRNGHVQVLPIGSQDGGLPSLVGFAGTNNDTWSTGDAALTNAAVNPCGTLYGTLRLLGRRYNEDFVQNQAELRPFVVVANASGEVAVKGCTEDGFKIISITEIATRMLTEVRHKAQAYLGSGKSLRRAVITVPACFGYHEKQVVKNAASLAGWKVLRLLSEPQSSALAYVGAGQAIESSGIRHDTSLERPKYGFPEANVLIVDVGGGTTSMAVFSMEIIAGLGSGVVEMKSVAGYADFGGDDFDKVLMKYCIEEFERAHNVRITATNPKALQRLRTACEAAKRRLSDKWQTTITLPSLFEDNDFATSITRPEFEDMCGPLFRLFTQRVQGVLEDAKMNKEHVNEVILVGGGSLIPKLGQVLREYFGGKEVRFFGNPVEANVVGAAIQAAILTVSGPQCGLTLRELLLLDVTTKSIGLCMNAGRMRVMIPRNKTIPTCKEQVFTTSVDGQTEMLVHVFEGDASCVKNNVLLGSFHLAGLAPAAKGVPRVAIMFDFDKTGDVFVCMEGSRSGASGPDSKFKRKSIGQGLRHEEVVKLMLSADCTLAPIVVEDEEE